MNALTTFLELSSSGVYLALIATFYAGLLAGVVLLINLFLRRWLTAAQMGLLWGLVLLRLVMPIAPSSMMSLESVVMPGGATNPNSTVRVGYSSAPLPRDVAGDSEQNQNAAQSSADSGLAWEDILGSLLVVGWPCGAAATIVWALTINYLFARKVRCAPICQDKRLLALWNECRRQVGVRRAIPIISFDALRQPAVMGLLRIRLLLPTTALELDDDQIRMVMLHELAHVKRRDLAVNWVMLVIRAIHWWNPVYWLAAARFSSLREQACDAFVIRQRPGQPSRSYSELLLTLAERSTTVSAWRVTLPASILGFFSSYGRNRAVRNRLGALRRASLRQSRWQVCGGAAFIGLIAVAGFTEARIPTEPKAHSSDWLPPSALQQPDAWVEGAEQVEGVVYPVAYEVRRALDRVIQGGKSEAEARKELEWLVSNELKRPIRIPMSTIADGSSKRQEQAEGYYKVDGDRLIVSASSIRHELLAQNLRAWEQSGLAQISIECRLLTPDHDLATAAGIGWNYVEAFSKASDDILPWSAKPDRPPISASASVEDYLPVVSAVLDDRRATALVKSLQGDRRSNVLQAPKVTCFNGQTFHIADVTYTPFVVGIRKGARGVQQPKIAVVDEGIKVTLRPVLSSDEKNVQLDGRIALSEIGKVSQVTSLLGADPTTIQIPRVKRCSINVSTQVKLGQSLLIGCLPHFERRQFFYVLLTPRRVDL